MSKEAKILMETVNAITEWHDFWGRQIFRLETVTGLPKEISIEKLQEGFKMTNLDLCCVLVIYQDLLTEHKIKSGLQEKSLKKLQKRNIEELVKCYEGKLTL